jgi:hypothetical protein
MVSVVTRKIFFSTISLSTSSGMVYPCSIESTPASTAFRVGWSPDAYAANLATKAVRLLHNGCNFFIR